MVINKLITKMMAVTMGVMAVLSVGNMAIANNHYDTVGRLYLDEAEGIETAYTKGRYKDDTSYGYIKNNWTSNDSDYAVALVGCNNDDGTEYYEDFDLYYYRVAGDSEDEYFLYNFVKENGYDYAAIKACSDGYQGYWINFLWSPDSVGGPN